MSDSKGFFLILCKNYQLYSGVHIPFPLTLLLLLNTSEKWLLGFFWEWKAKRDNKLSINWTHPSSSSQFLLHLHPPLLAKRRPFHEVKLKVLAAPLTTALSKQKRTWFMVLVCLPLYFLPCMPCSHICTVFRQWPFRSLHLHANWV